MVEAFCTKVDPICGTASYFRARHQIDELWHTCKIAPIAVTIFPYHFGSGNHRSYIVDFQMNSALVELSVLLYSLNKRSLT